MIEEINNDNKYYIEAKNKMNNKSTNFKTKLKDYIGWLFISNDMKIIVADLIRNKLRTNDLVAMLLAVIGIILNIVGSSEYANFEFKAVSLIKQNKTIEGIKIVYIGIESDAVFYIRLCTSLTTAILLLLIYRHYYLLLRLKIYKKKIPLSSSLCSSGLIWKLLLELIVCAIHSPPKINNILVTISSLNGNELTADIDIFLSSWVSLRAYLLLKYFAFNSTWAKSNVEKICNDFHTEGGISFAIKAELKENPYTLVLVALSISIFIFGYAMRNIELAFSEPKEKFMIFDWTNTFNGFWCIVMTILTVGYGDFYPQTTLGKIIAVLACVWGTILISLMVVSMTFSVEFSPQEEKAFAEIKRNKMQITLKKYAMIFIKTATELAILTEKRREMTVTQKYDIESKYKNLIVKYHTSFKKFVNFKKQLTLIDQDETPENILYELNDNILTEMDSLLSLANKSVGKISKYLKKSENLQDEIESDANKLLIITENLVLATNDENDSSY